ncbi:FtsX-like permease family protein [bacterium]|nr:FtsX-like permease family protein [bacterium]
MSLRAWLYLIRRETAAQPGRAVLLVLCAALSCAIGGLALAALFYLRSEVRPQIESLFPEERLVVRRPDVDVSILKLQFGKITDEIVAQIEAIPEVERVSPQMPAQFPIMAEMTIGRLDASYASDVVLHGVPAELIQDELPRDADFSWDPESGDPVPVAVSAYFLDLYNLGLAEGVGLPKLSPNAARNREFTLMLGESTLGFSKGESPKFVRAKIVGLTKNPLLVGLVAPIDVVRRWNAEFNPGQPASYAILHVDVRRPEDALAVRDRLMAMGLRVDWAAEDLQRFQRMITTAELVLFAVAAVILALTSVGIFSTVAMSTRERRAAWGLHRATGLGPWSLLGLVLAEGAILGVLSAVIGGAMAWGVAAALQSAAGEYLANLSFIPGQPFALGVETYAAILILALGLILVPTLLFALPACRAEPTRLLERRSL